MNSSIQPFNGFRPMQEQFRVQLPVGGYIAVIQDAQAENRADGNQMLVFRVDIAEGQYAGFYMKDYRAQEGGQFPARYRGVYRIFCPTNNLHAEDLWMLDRFNLTMGAIMASNPQFNWNWNTDSLKGMMVGISVRENEYNGCIFTEIGKFVPISAIRNGTFRPMRRRSSREEGSNIVRGYPPAATLAPQVSDFLQQPIAPIVPTSPVPQVQEPLAPTQAPALAPSVFPPETSLLPAQYTDDQDVPF